MLKSFGVLLSAAALCTGQQNPAAFIGAKIIPVSGPEIERGTLVVQAGKIIAVGPAASTNIPSGSTRIDATGKVIMPGLVDSHSHIGEPDGDPFEYTTHCIGTVIDGRLEFSGKR